MRFAQRHDHTTPRSPSRPPLQLLKRFAVTIVNAGLLVLAPP
jgi:hypothetical protein